MIDKLLYEVSAINKKYALINQKTGAYFNIFDIIDKASDEVVICRLIHDLLNPEGRHHQGDAFLRLFVREVLQINFTEQDYQSARVSKEHIVDGSRRRMDLFIETVNYKIPIEVKIHAGDQDRQCFDYYKQAKNSKLYYLTLEGGLPSEDSAEGLTPDIEEDERIGYKEIILISFRYDMIKWLDSCLALPETIKIAPVREILLQFKDVLLKLTEQKEGGEKMEIVDTIVSSAANMKSAIDIANTLQEAKAAVMLNLFRELKRLFENEGYKTYDYDEEVINEYFSSRKPCYPCLSVEIKKLPHNLTAMLCIQVDWNLYFNFAFTQVDKSGTFCEYEEVESVKAKYPEVYGSFANAVYDLVGSDGEKDEVSIFWDYLYDENGREFDFKHFSPSCIELASNYKEEARNMFDKLNSHIDKVRDKLMH